MTRPISFWVSAAVLAAVVAAILLATWLSQRSDAAVFEVPAPAPVATLAAPASTFPPLSLNDRGEMCNPQGGCVPDHAVAVSRPGLPGEAG